MNKSKIHEYANLHLSTDQNSRRFKHYLSPTDLHILHFCQSVVGIIKSSICLLFKQCLHDLHSSLEEIINFSVTKVQVLLDSFLLLIGKKLCDTYLKQQ